jgi:hypothetical protein
MEEHLLERGKAIRRGKGDREGVTKIDEGSSIREKELLKNKNYFYCKTKSGRRGTMLTSREPHIKATEISLKQQVADSMLKRSDQNVKKFMLNTPKTQGVFSKSIFSMPVKKLDLILQALKRQMSCLSTWT